MKVEILTKLKEINDLLNEIHGNQPKADTAFYELQKLKELLQAEEQEDEYKKRWENILHELKCVLSDIGEAIVLKDFELLKMTKYMAEKRIKEIEKELKE